MRLFLLMLIVTAVEVVLIAKVGAAIGFLPTFLIIIFTAFLGSRLLAQQWRFVMSKLQSLQGNPSQALAEAVILLMCGVLLVTPGFLTDIVGFLGLIPAVRERFVQALQKHGGNMMRGSFRVYSSHSPFGGAQQPFQQRPDDNVIEGEFERKDD